MPSSFSWTSSLSCLPSFSQSCSMGNGCCPRTPCAAGPGAVGAVPLASDLFFAPCPQGPPSQQKS
eukprot:CAMPEP_0171111416 /NCGR_PEP_ID=MMETSP0766_2-20121228/74979_1 /TAXON_ID=439317 /ORGANISM="Gambierdiscus australes, Strain CAWD 149" /LENGTH=64 /DNA_ID=CAMNT_0011573393 /DNA_START=34 /DNA_END=225 /DNA_ORIENTATION=+